MDGAATRLNEYCSLMFVMHVFNVFIKVKKRVFMFLTSTVPVGRNDYQALVKRLIQFTQCWWIITQESVH